MEYKLFFDTNALLNLQQSAFQENFVISQKTLEEIEDIKTSRTRDEDIKYKARKVAHLLDEHYGLYTVVHTTPEVKRIIDEKSLTWTSDNIILASACHFNADVQPILLVSDDINVKFISREIFGLPTKGTREINLITDIEEYTGYKEITLTDEEMSYFYTHLDENTYDCLINQYLILHKLDGEIVDTLRWTGTGYKKVCNRTIRSLLFGDKIRPKDVYQACVIDSIYENTITMISGKAGSGKTLLTLATIMNLIEIGEYDRVIIMFNPTKAKGASNMGYYTGDATEKAMQNSIGSILTTKFGDRYAVETLLAQDKIRLVSMADIRGMEVRPTEALILTEAQNTSADLLKLCLSRAAEGCKIIIEGDYNSQVDSHLFENGLNGLKRAIDVLQGEEICGYVQLKNVWRSRIAELVDKF